MRQLFLISVLATALIGLPLHVQALSISPADESASSADEFESALTAARGERQLNNLVKSSDELAKARSLLQNQMKKQFEAAFVAKVGEWTREASAVEPQSRHADDSDMGTTLDAVYTKENNKIEIKMIIESPMLGMMAPLLSLAKLDPNAAKNLFMVGPYQGLVKERDGSYQGLIMISERIMLSAEGQKGSTVNGEDLKALLQGLNYEVIR